MRAACDRLFHTYGLQVKISTAEGERTVCAFLQLLRQKTGGDLPEETGLGADDLRRWLYLGPTEAPLAAGDRLYAGGKDYVVEKAETIRVGDRPSHVWAILRRAREVFP